MTFAQIVEEATSFPLDVQEELIELLNKRYHERRRDELAQSFDEAHQEYRDGKTELFNAEDFRKEMLS